MKISTGGAQETAAFQHREIEVNEASTAVYRGNRTYAAGGHNWRGKVIVSKAGGEATIWLHVGSPLAGTAHLALTKQGAAALIEALRAAYPSINTKE